MADEVIVRSEHEDGRVCILGPDGIWRHWDNEGVHPGPRDAVDWECRRDHPMAENQRLIPATPGAVAEDDRGEFGMPTIGGVAFSPYADQVIAAMSSLPTGSTVVKINVEGMTVEYPDGKGNVTIAETDDARYILTEVLPALLERFLMKNAKYRLAQVHDLGVKGVIPDINRKSSVIIDRIWNGQEQIDEDTEEVIDDLIGHLLLIRAKMRTR